MRAGFRLLTSLGAAILALGLAGPVVAEAPLPIPKPASALVADAAPHRAAAIGTITAPPVRIDGLAPSGISGWIAVDLDTGAVVDERHADTGFVPASVAKLPTAAFALDVLGPEHRFRTRLLATGPVRNGRLMGDLVLKGGGDPELDTDSLLPLARALQTRGVRSVAGALLADGTALPQVAEITRGQKIDAAYNPSVSGLNLNFNRVHLKWDARKGHEFLSVEAAAAKLSPSVNCVRVLLTGAAGGPLFSHRTEDGREIWEMARRAYRGHAARWLPVKGPETYAADVFREIAAAHGAALPRPRLGQAPAGAEVLAMMQSRPLGGILRDMLKYSTNLTAEVTGSAASRAAGIDARTLAESAAVMNAWAAGVAGFPAGDPGFRLVNHSGLTLGSRVSPRRMVELLVALTRPGTGAAAGFPSGIAPYLAPLRLDDAPAGLRVVAKTGTMSFVRGLAGYAMAPGGQRLAFAIFSNDLAARGDGPERVNRHWLNRARAFEHALIRSWTTRADGA